MFFFLILRNSTKILPSKVILDCFSAFALFDHSVILNNVDQFYLPCLRERRQDLSMEKYTDLTAPLDSAVGLFNSCFVDTSPRVQLHP